MASDILFLLSDTGGGHRSVTIALTAGIEELTDGHVKCRIDDLLCRTKLPLLENAPTIYDRLTNRYLSIYNAGFVLTDSATLISLLSRMVYAAARHRIISALRDFDPKLIVVTHPFLLGHLVCSSRRDQGFRYRVVTVVADPVSVHAGWGCSDVDAYIVFSESARESIKRLGIPYERIALTSFPVHPDFSSECYAKEDARQMLDISNESFTVLITGGGAGAGITHELVLLLERDESLQLLVVTGNNTGLYRHLVHSTRFPKTRVYGRVRNMAILMAACDVVITKPGPSTLMEAAAVNRPAIIIGAVGPQEVGNIGLALRNGLGVACKRTAEVINAVRTIRQGGLGDQPVRSLRIGRSEPARILLNELERVL